MRVFILRSASMAYAFASLLESKDFWLVPTENSHEFSIYDKKVFSLEIVRAEEPKEVTA